eukprot:gene27190-2434_t
MLPVAVCQTVTLVAEAALGDSVMALKEAVHEAAKKYGSLSCGVIRIEVPLARGCTALRWLRGQTDAGEVPRLKVYFSPRHSSAPDTPGAAKAEADTKGWAAVAGLDTAWMWQGAPESGFDAEVVRSMNRFLSSSSERIRIIGGTRAHSHHGGHLKAAEEWAGFGSYCFVLPLLEFLESSNSNLLACTLAWDADSCAVEHSRSCPVGVGSSSMAEAAARVLGALDQCKPPASTSAASLQISRAERGNIPDEGAWHTSLDQLIDSLEDGRSPDSDDLFASWDQAPQAAPLDPDLESSMARQEYLTNGQQGLDDLIAALDASVSDGDLGGGELWSSWKDSVDSLGRMNMEAEGSDRNLSNSPMVKTVMARRTLMHTTGELDPLAVLEALQERDPRAYQLSMNNSVGGTFLGCTPERLYVRSGTFIASEAVAGTRPRGAAGELHILDEQRPTRWLSRTSWLTLDLLKSQRTTLNSHWLETGLKMRWRGGQQVIVEVPKSVLKQGSMQHLYGRLAAEMRTDVNDAHVLKALHPTPAVCGRPRELALRYLEKEELFDRGFYAGPFGWLSGGGAEFVVAIRSALMQEVAPEPSASKQPQSVAPACKASTAREHAVHLFAGVGVVRGSDPYAEWQELDLKVRQFRKLLTPTLPIDQQPNMNAAWCALLVEELCRHGCNMFCVAPGSRSSPLTLAVSQHPRARLNVCIDERSLGFWALGYSRASGRPAIVITSSGTAVANLLPAAVEASLSHVPLLLITADRPVELRETGANQTIDQVKIFGSFSRWSHDMPPPQESSVGRHILTTVATAVRRATAAGEGSTAGPVHLNIQLREPLAPIVVPWQPVRFSSGLQTWSTSQVPFTTTVDARLSVTRDDARLWREGSAPARLSCIASSLSSEMGQLVACLQSARRGLIVVGEMLDASEIVQVVQLCKQLGWPVAADILSGLRVGSSAGSRPSGGDRVAGKSDRSPITTNHMSSDDRRSSGSEASASRTNGGSDGNSSNGNTNCNGVAVFGSDTISAAAGVGANTHGNGNGRAVSAKDCISAGAGGDGEDVELHGERHGELGGSLCVLHHMDHVLLGDKEWWGSIKPDVILQIGGHLTSKRLCQFMEWSAQDSGNVDDPPAKWIFVAQNTERHDASHLVSMRATIDLDTLQIVAAISSTPGPTPPHASEFARLLIALDKSVSSEVDGALQTMPMITEPYVARRLSSLLPSAHALFLGNSMPIRDMEMYARAGGGGVGELGVPVAANRGASGIDGVLSTAAGFAEGLTRPTTLVVGDLSFLHDVNGLNLLRGGEARPPLTVLLINNAGGAIFSFLPIADALPQETFTPLWATPQNTCFPNVATPVGITTKCGPSGPVSQRDVHKPVGSTSKYGSSG